MCCRQWFILAANQHKANQNNNREHNENLKTICNYSNQHLSISSWLCTLTRKTKRCAQKLELDHMCQYNIASVFFHCELEARRSYMFITARISHMCQCHKNPYGNSHQVFEAMRRAGRTIISGGVESLRLWIFFFFLHIMSHAPDPFVFKCLS